MRLESAMRASREGLVAHGQALSVFGDNISNVNTTAHKGQRAEFVALLGEKADDRGATVPAGAGDGVAVGRIRVDFSVGTTSPTGRELDVALTGAGFFLVGNPEAPALTRAGNFQINNDGVLSTSDGLPVLGYVGEGQEELEAINMANLVVEPQPTTAMNLFGNIDGTSGIAQPPENAETFRELNADAAFVSTQSVYDAAGARREISLFYFRTAPNDWTVQAYANGIDVGQELDQPVLLGQANFAFNNIGSIPDDQRVQAALNLNPAWADGVAQTPFVISLADLTQYAGPSQIVNVQQDGTGTGDIVAFEFDNDGGIFGITVAREKVQIGTLALGTVTNNDGLLRLSNSLYTATEDSGPLRIGQALQDGMGGIQGQALELSNVDLPKQFVDMIVHQRGYQANSQILTAASELIKSTIAMIR